MGICTINLFLSLKKAVDDGLQFDIEPIVKIIERIGVDASFVFGKAKKLTPERTIVRTSPHTSIPAVNIHHSSSDAVMLIVHTGSTTETSQPCSFNKSVGIPASNP